jgi:hypothetical protein
LIYNGDFSDGDLAWMAFLAGATAAAISNIYRDIRSNVLRYLRNSLISSNLDEFDYSSFYQEVLGFLTSSETAFKAAILHVCDSGEMKLRAFEISDGVTPREDNNARMLGQGFVGLAVKSAEPQIIERITESGLAEEFINSGWIKENNFESFGCFPLIIPGKDGVTVTLSLFADYEYEFHPTSVEFLNEVISSIALLVQQEKRIGENRFNKSLSYSSDSIDQLTDEAIKYPLQTVSKPFSGSEAEKLTQAIQSGGYITNETALSLMHQIAKRRLQKSKNVSK